MADRAPGTPIWTDLAAPDQDKAASFYKELFGWEAQDAGPSEETGGYKFFLRDGKMVGGFGPPGDGEPPSWRIYVQTTDTDETAQKVRDAGGQLILEPMDVMDVGRMTVFTDSEGAVCCAWQPERHSGADVFNEPGSMSWTELHTRAPDKAKEFYPAVFGWEPHDTEMEGRSYTEWKLDGRSIAGMLVMDERFPAEVPPHWLVYFATEDPDATFEKAQGAGGNVLAPLMDLPVGRFGVLADPNGAPFATIRIDQPPS